VTKKEQRRFINELFAAVKDSLQSKLSKVPKNWDGHELREWIADAFDSEATLRDKQRMGSTARLRAYRNDVLTKGL
jgi:hypothetical protein